MTKTAIQKLVEHVATKAVEEKTPFCEAIDALKAVTAYLTMEQKQKGATEPEDDEEPSFATFQQDLDDAEGKGHGTAAVATRSDRGTRTARGN